MQIGDLVEALRTAYAKAPHGEQSTQFICSASVIPMSLQVPPINEIAVHTGLTKHWRRKFGRGIQLRPLCDIE